MNKTVKADFAKEDTGRNKFESDLFLLLGQLPC